MKTYLAHYLIGTAASAFNGGVAAVSGVFGPQLARLAGATAQNAPDLTPNQLWGMFWGASLASAIMYFKAHPLPVIDPNARPSVSEPTK